MYGIVLIMVIFLDDMEPSSCIGGTNVVHGIDTEEDINTIFKMGTLLCLFSGILVNRRCVYFHTVMFRHRPSVHRLRCHSMIYRF
jgi:hypothetical protein